MSIRSILDSPWFYFSAAGILLAVAIATQIDLNIDPREEGTVAELETLRDRDDLNLVFILIDMLRADRLSAYGYQRGTSPVMKDIASRGIRFAHVESQSSWTKASMASMWTGMYPERTGILRFGHALPEAATLPAELFKEAGFRTAGIWRNGWIANNFGFGQGFDLYVRPRPNRSAQRVRRNNPSAHALQGTDLDATESAMEFMINNRSERFFLYVHYMDVHQYLYADVSPDYGSSFSDFYDSSIFWTDLNVSFLMKALRDMGLSDKTLVVIASDHGEAFFEHGMEGHARMLYRETQEVPLIILPPFDLAGGVVVEERVANVDIWPTILDLMGMPELPGAEGISLVPLIEQAARNEVEGIGDRPIFAQLDLSWGKGQRPPNPLVSVVKGDYRLVQRTLAPDTAEFFVHSIERGKPNVAKDHPGPIEEMRADIDAFLAIEPTQWTEAPTVELDEMRQHQLRALGYVVDGRKAAPPPGAQRRQQRKQKQKQQQRPDEGEAPLPAAE